VCQEPAAVLQSCCIRQCSTLGLFSAVRVPISAGPYGTPRCLSSGTGVTGSRVRPWLTLLRRAQFLLTPGVVATRCLALKTDREGGGAYVEFDLRMPIEPLSFTYEHAPVRPRAAERACFVFIFNLSDDDRVVEAVEDSVGHSTVRRTQN
jgi:hypothetical protein